MWFFNCPEKWGWYFISSVKSLIHIGINLSAAQFGFQMAKQTFADVCTSKADKDIMFYFSNMTRRWGCHQLDWNKSKNCLNGADPPSTQISMFCYWGTLTHLVEQNMWVIVKSDTCLWFQRIKKCSILPATWKKNYWRSKQPITKWKLDPEESICILIWRKKFEGVVLVVKVNKILQKWSIPLLES